MFALFENLTNWLWGLPLLITILATGVYLTVRSGFFQFRHFGYIVKNMFSKERRQEGGDDGKSQQGRPLVGSSVPPVGSSHIGRSSPTTAISS